MATDSATLMQEIITLILTSSVITAIITSIVQWIKWRDGERGQSNATSVKIIAEASAILIEPLKKQINEIIEQNKELEIEFKTLREEHATLKIELAIMKDWAERLVNQVISLGGTPVKRKRVNINSDEVE